jgi:hypothetical protein
VPRTLAALASIPQRAHFLPRVLASLRPQVERLHVYLNGWANVPECVRDLADEYIIAPANEGAERKLQWSNPSQSSSKDASDGFFYLSCDDDFVYGENYVEAMCAAVEQWQGRAIVTGHGRVYRAGATHFHHVVPQSVGLFYKRVSGGWWVNYGGTGVMAWDTREVTVPSAWPERNILDAQLAVWAQRERVPMWLVPHDGKWIKPLALIDPNGIFRTSCRESHARRSALIASTPWQLHSLSPARQACGDGTF